MPSESLADEFSTLLERYKKSDRHGCDPDTVSRAAIEIANHHEKHRDRIARALRTQEMIDGIIAMDEKKGWFEQGEIGKVANKLVCALSEDRLSWSRAVKSILAALREATK